MGAWPPALAEADGAEDAWNFREKSLLHATESEWIGLWSCQCEGRRNVDVLVTAGEGSMVSRLQG
jgi:hypothetical protein